MTETIKLSTLDTHFADFIVRIDKHPGDALWWGAALASNAATRGHSCFNLYELPPFPQRIPPPPADTARWFEALQQCDTVGAPGAFTPLVLEPAGRLYLQRCWKYEQTVATQILSRCQAPLSHDADLETALDRYFPIQEGVIDLQRSAARMALTHRFSVISGGPGTGKTATVARILALLCESIPESPPTILLAAPTGKAALRLHQSIMQAAGRLALADDIRKRLPTEVQTIHRLLGVQPRSGGFRHNHDNRLTCDVLVVDEASMVDLQLMASLLEALRDDARVILLGDRNQLASVEAGAVLANICDSAGQAGIPVTQLSKSYRFGDDSGIAALSHLITGGESAAASALLKAERYLDIKWRPLPSGATFENTFTAAVRDGYAGYAHAASPENAIAALNSFKVLSPLHAGPYGVENLNRLCLNVVAEKQRIDPQHLSSRPVMVSGNNYELGLFNGDTGVILENEGVATVWFENPEGVLRHLSPLRLPPTETAFALTVHKSQGSEFERVLLILPEKMSDVLSRELLYTAVTRARSHIEIWCSEEIFRQTVERRTERTSGLGERFAAGVGMSER